MEQKVVSWDESFSFHIVCYRKIEVLEIVPRGVSPCRLWLSN